MRSLKGHKTPKFITKNQILRTKSSALLKIIEHKSGGFMSPLPDAFIRFSPHLKTKFYADIFSTAYEQYYNSFFVICQQKNLSENKSAHRNAYENPDNIGNERAFHAVAHIFDFYRTEINAQCVKRRFGRPHKC